MNNRVEPSVAAAFREDPIGSSDVHADLAGCIPAKHGTVLHKNHLCTGAGSRNGRSQTRRTAPGDNDLGFHLVRHEIMGCQYDLQTG